MKKSRTRLPAALLALALMLPLLAGCGAGTAKESASPATSPEQSQETAPSQSASEPVQPSEAQPSEPPEPTPAPSATPEPTPAPEPTPKPTLAPTPTPAPTQSVPADGNYTADVALAGGSGRASIQSPARLRCAGGQFYATIVWSSPNFDYMKVNGTRYDPISAAGENSAFEIPVAAFDIPLAVIADTVAMSEPHEVEYTVTFHSASLTMQ